MSDEKITFHITGSGALVNEYLDMEKAKVFEGEQELFSEVCRRLSQGSEQLGPYEVTREGLLSAVVISLELDHAAAITGLYTDQWSAVVANKHDKSFATWVECYDLLAGVAMTWKLFADRKEK